MKKIHLLFTSLLTISFLFACNKTPGVGGTSSITGKVWLVDLNTAGDTVAQYYAADEDVYIIYGTETQTYSDKFATSYDGSFRFDYLTTGKYTVFAYSKCTTCPNGQNVIKKEIEITEKKQVIEMEDLVILN